jgi:6-phosphogluconolactonase
MTNIKEDEGRTGLLWGLNRLRHADIAAAPAKAWGILLIAMVLVACGRTNELALTPTGPATPPEQLTTATPTLEAAPTLHPTVTPEAVTAATDQPLNTPGVDMMPTETAESATVLAYIGSYTRRSTDGIHIYRFDPATGALDLLAGIVIENASFLAIHPNKQYLYAVNELGEFQGQPTGGVSAFRIDPETGMLILLNQQPSHGASPAHITIDREGSFVYTANYTSGTVSVYPVQEDGSLGAASDVVQHVGSGPDPRRQQGPHAHSINLDPSNRFAYVADLGLDKVMIYNVHQEPGKLLPADPPFAEVDGGSGPRHLAFHPGGRFVYLINEMGNTITVFSQDAESGGLKFLQTVPTLPEEFTGHSTTADIHVLPTGDFVYGSNRGHDSIVVYAVNRDDGTLTYVEHVSTQGQTPRNFGIDPTGTYLVAANQDSDNLVVFRIDVNTGKLTPTGDQASVSMPVCVKFLVP